MELEVKTYQMKSVSVTDWAICLWFLSCTSCTGRWSTQCTGGSRVGMLSGKTRIKARDSLESLAIQSGEVATGDQGSRLGQPKKQQRQQKHQKHQNYQKQPTYKSRLCVIAAVPPPLESRARTSIPEAGLCNRDSISVARKQKIQSRFAHNSEIREASGPSGTPSFDMSSRGFDRFAFFDQGVEIHTRCSLYRTW